MQCDEAKPACSQCLKSKRICPGYTAQFDLILRDQTRSTRRRVQRQQNQLAKPTIPEEDGLSRLDAVQEAFMTWSAANLSSTSPLLLGPDPSNIEDLAICRFFTNYVLLPRHHEAFRGFLDALPPLFNRAPNGSVLSLATSAVALAIIGGNPSHPREAILAQKRLGKALTMAHEAVADPVDSLKDETLMAVLVGYLRAFCYFTACFLWL